MLRAMKHLPILLLLAAAPLQAAAQEPVSLGGEVWAQPRPGEVLRGHPALRRLVTGLGPGDGLRIRHPEGEEGSVWAGRLRGWLVTLGVPSARIELTGDAPGDDGLLLEGIPRNQEPEE